MPARMLREGILDSKAVCNLSDSGQIFYRCLMSIVDDYGRFEVDLDLIRTKCFWRQIDRWQLSRVEDALSECSLAISDDGQPLVLIYQISKTGKKYLQINNFQQRLRQMVEKCPSPDGGLRTDDRQPPPEVKGSEVKSEEVKGREVSEGNRCQKPPTHLPENSQKLTAPEVQELLKHYFGFEVADTDPILGAFLALSASCGANWDVLGGWMGHKGLSKHRARYPVRSAGAVLTFAKEELPKWAGGAS